MQRIRLNDNRPPSLESGFTLIEVLIGVVIFSVGIMAVGVMQQQSVGSTTMAGHVAYNNAAATDCVERLLRLSYDDVRLNVTSPYDSVLGLYADYGTSPPYMPAQDDDFIDNDRDGAVDEDGETGPVSVRWWVTETDPVPGENLMKYKTVVVRIDRGVQDRPGHLFMILQRNLPNTMGI